ncbi:MAG TPA: hypothetical protein C5S37_00950 [Methanophagales archaeon]|nr:hypothetical protein [Methanophagales archaeon]
MVVVYKEGKEELLESVPYLLKMPSNRIWIDYDEDADVLYVSFQKPQHADDSEMKDNIIYHYLFLVRLLSCQVHTQVLFFFPRLAIDSFLSSLITFFFDTPSYCSP